MGRLWDDWGGPADTEDGPPTTRLKPPSTPAKSGQTPRQRLVDLEAPERILDSDSEPEKPAT
jgi:hypothetical protein